MLVAFSVAPGTAADDGTVHDALAPAIRIIRESGIPYRTDAMFTTLEGSWDECFDVVRRCCEELEKSSPRVSLVLKADMFGPRTGELDGKLQRLESALESATEA